MKLLFGFFLICFYSLSLSAQILHSESFSVIIDTNKKIKGSIIPDFKFQNQKKDLIEFENRADVSFRFKKNALTFANKIELTKYGSEAILSGGYVYVEYRRIFEKKFSIEPFSQVQWADARGLEFKYAGGINARYRAKQTDKFGLFFGSGPFYEKERWNYRGVKDHLVPENAQTTTVEKVKLGTYASLLWVSPFRVTFEFSAYHQAAFDELFSTPRLASSSSVIYKFTEHLGLSLTYQNIYDYSPIVPIDRLFNKLIFTIEVSF